MSDVTIPDDPVDVLIHRFASRARSMALQMMDENLIISDGMSHHPNTIESLGITYEALPSDDARDASAKDWAARQLCRLRERTHKQLDPWLVSQALRNLRKRTAGRV